jgi:hypothetical protein
MSIASIPLNGDRIRRIDIVAAGEPPGGPASGVGHQAAQLGQPDNELTELLAALERFPEFDQRTIRYHLQQSQATAADGYWHAAINEARSFLEGLVVSIAMVEQRGGKVVCGKGYDGQGTWRLCRKFLVDAGFLDRNEDEFLLHVYGIGSSKGAHHGVTDEPWCDTTLGIIFTTALYLLRRYETWKQTAPQRAAGERQKQAATPASRRRKRRFSPRACLLRLWSALGRRLAK